MSRTEFKSHIKFEFNGITALFGNKHFVLDKYCHSKKISRPQFCNQTHSSKLLRSVEGLILDCDALFTHESKHILAIKTADCVPVLVINDNTVFAIHAGWRGLNHGILKKLESFNISSTAIAIVGPHILQQNYEVGSEVIAQIIKNNPSLKTSNFYQANNNSRFQLDLYKITQHQLLNLGFSSNNIVFENIDTFSNNNWYSYRRNCGEAGRNISLIYKT